MQTSMSRKPRAGDAEKGSGQGNTDRGSEGFDGHQMEPPICCVTLSKLSNLSEPLLHLESGADYRDSAAFSGLSIKRDLSLHPVHA